MPLGSVPGDVGCGRSPKDKGGLPRPQERAKSAQALDDRAGAEGAEGGSEARPRSLCHGEAGGREVTVTFTF